MDGKNQQQQRSYGDVEEPDEDKRKR